VTGETDKQPSWPGFRIELAGRAKDPPGNDTGLLLFRIMKNGLLGSNPG